MLNIQAPAGFDRRIGLDDRSPETTTSDTASSREPR
jgi:hypothetical protein